MHRLTASLLALHCRLKYLLSQSDIFSHFGNVKAGGVATSAAAAAASSSGGRSLKNSRRNVSSDELDDDEKELARAELDDEDGEAAGDATAKHQGSAMLTKQPSCITGGAMRCALPS